MSSNDHYKVYNNGTYTLERITKDGFIERMEYSGTLKDKPKGWKVISK